MLNPKEMTPICKTVVVELFGGVKARLATIGATLATFQARQGQSELGQPRMWVCNGGDTVHMIQNPAGPYIWQRTIDRAIRTANESLLPVAGYLSSDVVFTVVTRPFIGSPCPCSYRSQFRVQPSFTKCNSAWWT